MSDQVDSLSVNKSCLSSESDDSSKLAVQVPSGGSGYEADDEISVEAYADPSSDSEVDMPLQGNALSPRHQNLPPPAATVAEGFGDTDGTQIVGDGGEEGASADEGSTFEVIDDDYEEVASNLKRHRVRAWGSPLKRARRRF